MSGIWAFAIAAMLAQSAPASAPEASAVPIAEEVSLGGFVAPAVLPPGTLAAYGFVGAPQVGAGFRQGIAGVELDVEAHLDWFQLAFAIESVVRFELFERGALRLAPLLGAGLVGNSGARGLDPDNFGALSLRFLPGLLGTVQVSDTLTAIVLLELPYDLGLTPAGTNRFNALLGGGAELALDETLSVGLLAQAGVERFKAPGLLDRWRFAWQVRAGLGFRIF